MDEVERVLGTLSDPRWDWRTVHGVSRETGIDPDRVLEIINGRPDLVIRSRIPDKKGQPLYTTREHYKKTHSPLIRIIDQLRSTST